MILQVGDSKHRSREQVRLDPQKHTFFKHRSSGGMTGRQGGSETNPQICWWSKEYQIVPQRNWRFLKQDIKKREINYQNLTWISRNFLFWLVGLIKNHTRFCFANDWNLPDQTAWKCSRCDFGMRKLFVSKKPCNSTNGDRNSPGNSASLWPFLGWWVENVTRPQRRIVTSNKGLKRSRLESPGGCFLLFLLLKAFPGTNMHQLEIDELMDPPPKETKKKTTLGTQLDS